MLILQLTIFCTTTPSWFPRPLCPSWFPCLSSLHGLKNLLNCQQYAQNYVLQCQCQSQCFQINILRKGFKGENSVGLILWNNIIQQSMRTLFRLPKLLKDLHSINVHRNKGLWLWQVSNQRATAQKGYIVKNCAQLQLIPTNMWVGGCVFLQ